MTWLKRIVVGLALVVAMGCGDTDLNKDLKPVNPEAKPFTPSDMKPGAKGEQPAAPTQTQKVITK